MILLEFKQELKQSKKKNLVLEQDMIKKMLIMIVKIDIYFVAQQQKNDAEFMHENEYSGKKANMIMYLCVMNK